MTPTCNVDRMIKRIAQSEASLCLFPGDLVRFDMESAFLLVCIFEFGHNSFIKTWIHCLLNCELSPPLLVVTGGGCSFYKILPLAKWFLCAIISFFQHAMADVEVTFDLYSLEEAEVLDANLADPQLICSKKGASIKGGVGPFGLLALASKDMQEQTVVFFRVFKGQGNKKVVVMCSDQSK
ncbi:unnamed protein product [Victoria cruziana]